MHRIALNEIHPDLTQDRENLVRLDIFSHGFKTHLMADAMDSLDDLALGRGVQRHQLGQRRAVFGAELS